jgi:hypothetical protein
MQNESRLVSEGKKVQENQTYNVLIHGRPESTKKSTNFVDILIVKIAKLPEFLVHL